MTPLQAERSARGWTQARVADELRDLAWQLGHGELGIDANAVSRHERGVISRARDPLPVLYAVLYDTTVEVLWPGRVGLEGEEVRVERRRFLRTAGGIAAGMAGGRVLADRDPEVLLERARATTARYRGDDDHRPATELVGPVLRLAKHLDRLTDQHPTLASAASEAASFAGWLFADLDNQVGARTWYRAAIRRAEQAGDATLTAYQLGSLAQLAADTGHGLGAVRLVEQASAQLGPDRPPVADAWLAATQAVALASVRELHGTLAALERAEDMGAALATWPWLTAFDPVKLAGYRGACEVRLGRPTAASHLGRALTGKPTASKQRALLLVDLAAARRADPEEAARLLGEAHSVAVAKKSERITRRVLAVRRRLDSRDPSVRQLDQQLLTGWL